MINSRKLIFILWSAGGQKCRCLLSFYLIVLVYVYWKHILKLYHLSPSLLFDEDEGDVLQNIGDYILW